MGWSFRDRLLFLGLATCSAQAHVWSATKAALISSSNQQCQMRTNFQVGQLPLHTAPETTSFFSSTLTTTSAPTKSCLPPPTLLQRYPFPPRWQYNTTPLWVLGANVLLAAAPQSSLKVPQGRLCLPLSYWTQWLPAPAASCSLPRHPQPNRQFTPAEPRKLDHHPCFQLLAKQPSWGLSCQSSPLSPCLWLTSGRRGTLPLSRHIAPRIDPSNNRLS